MDVIVKWVYRSWSMGFATTTNVCSWERGERMGYARDKILCLLCNTINRHVLAFADVYVGCLSVWLAH